MRLGVGVEMELNVDEVVSSTKDLVFSNSFSDDGHLELHFYRNTSSQCESAFSYTIRAASSLPPVQLNSTMVDDTKTRC